MGKLYVVPTPIGNLGDITYRALEVLKNCQLILAEDTRTSSKLLKHYNIDVKTSPFHQHNEHKLAQKYVNYLLENEDHHIAIISDAGTPGISDPAFLLIRLCLENLILIECLPGATAFIPALIKSGIPADRFVFEGFLPHKKGKKKRLSELEHEERTIIFYESPHRLVKTLTAFCEVFGDQRPASVSRELTKKFEETINGTLFELKQHFENNSIKGEFVIVIQGKKNTKVKKT